MTKILLILTLILGVSSQAIGQLKGEEPAFNPDTVFIFQSPRKLMTISDRLTNKKEAAGADLLFSNSGFGLGFFYRNLITSDLSLNIRFFLSGARNTDEFEYYDYFSGDRVVPGKINRLYMMPLTFGVSKFLFQDVLHKSLRPHISAGVGPTFILSTPYSKSFFDAFNYAKWYTRFGSYVGIGAVVGNVGGSSTFMSVNIDYYYIPFGGNGLESVKDSPIKNFGGIFLSLSLGGIF